MKLKVVNLLKKPIIIVSLCLMAILIPIAICVEWNSTEVIKVLTKPLLGIGNYIRNLFISEKATSASKFGGWALFIFLGALPIAIPIVLCIMRKKFSLLSLLWLLPIACGYAMLYFAINPHLLLSTVTVIPQEAQEPFNLINLLGLLVVYAALVLICALVEAGIFLKYKPQGSYLFAKLIICIFIIGIIFSACFVNLFNINVKLAALNESLAVQEELQLNINASLNRFGIIFPAVSSFLPAIITVILLIKCMAFIDKLKVDSLNQHNIKPLESIILFAKISVIVTLAVSALNNIVALSLSRYMVNNNYIFNLPISEILGICLVLIFSHVFKRAVEVNEENKLTI